MQFEQLILIFARVAGFMFAAPIFSSPSIPGRIKASIAMIISILIFPYVDVINIDLGPYMLRFLIYIFSELAIGIILGTVSEFFFSAVRFAGEFIGRQIGFAMVNVLDPQTQQQVSILGFWNYLVAIMVFLSINGHHVFFKAIAQSFDYIKLSEFRLSEQLFEQILSLLSYIFIIGLQISLPLLTTMLIITVALGFVAKAVPQIQVFMLSFPLKILGGLLTYVFFIPLFSAFLVYVYNKLGEELMLCMKYMI